MNNIAETSKASYRELNESGKKIKQRTAIIDCLELFSSFELYQSQGGFSRRQIADVLQMDNSTVGARVNKLIKDKLLESAGTFKDPVTNVSVGLVRLPAEHQLSLI